MYGALPIARIVVNVIACLGVSKVVKDAVTINTVVKSPADAIRVWTGSLVIGSMVVAKASEYVNTNVDELIAWHENRKTNLTVVE